ncbi:MAG TPA: proline dehydrogenase family protein [Gemmatimonadales bacterium]|nr:proline dehydrogenase family protein [Gemmatimonadales bacterium]
MSLARSILLRASKSQWLARQASERAFAQKAVRKFMPGEELEDALGASAALKAAGFGTVLTQLGESLTGLSQADAVRDHYLALFDEVKQRDLPIQVSVKPTQLGLDHSIEECRTHILTLTDKARATGGFLWLDMEDSSYVDRTLDLYRSMRQRYDKVGLALQAYLRRTPADVAALLPLRPSIRLVKGAYAEPASVAFEKKSETDVAYFDLAITLLAASAKGECYTVLGTHDIGLLARLTARAAELGAKDGNYEIHMLYGIRTRDQQALEAAGRKMRVLISYGRKWFPWYMRRLAERPANVWFVVKSALAG